MKVLKNFVFPILITGIWINFSETARWLLIIENYWVEHYNNLNIVFPTDITNVIIWLIWGFLLSGLIFILTEKFSIIKTALISWFAVFVLLWLVLWNINILPVKILWIVVPLSLVETFVGAWICNKTSNKSH